MLLVPELKTFTSKHSCDLVTHIEAIIAWSADPKDQLNDIVNRAAGGQPANNAMDEGFITDGASRT